MRGGEKEGNTFFALPSTFHGRNEIKRAKEEKKERSLVVVVVSSFGRFERLAIQLSTAAHTLSPGKLATKSRKRASCKTLVVVVGNSFLLCEKSHQSRATHSALLCERPKEPFSAI